MLRRRREERGAAAVEFALVLVPFVTLIFGLIQYGIYFWAVQGGSNAARQAARDAAVGQPLDCATYRTNVRGTIAALSSDENSATVTRDYKTAAGQPVQVGDDVEVHVVFHALDLNFPFLPFINGGEVAQSATARVEYVPNLSLADCS